MKRRAFLLATSAALGGGLVIGYSAWRSKLERQAKDTATSRGETLLANWVKVAPDGTITVLVPHADMGQGVFTALAMVLAEELDADWAHMRAERAPAELPFANGYLVQGFILGTKPLPAVADDLARAGFAEAARLRNVQVTGGSLSVRATGQMGLRLVGAAARAMLIEAAARRWYVPASELQATRSVVTHKASGRTASYGELAQAAAEISPPARPRLKTRSEYRLIGTLPRRFDIAAKSSGRELYGIDLQLPDMKVATVMAAPVTGGTLLEVDAAPALALSGVERVVKFSDAVAVVGRGYWYAHRGLRALEPRWSDGGNGAVTSETIARQNLAALASGEAKVLHKVGDVARAAKGRTIEATYEVPLLYHAAIEPINVTARWANGKLTVWCGEQDALGAKANVLEVSSLSSSEVEFIGMPIGGGFGRRSPRRSDHFRQVVQLARELTPHPVKLIWSREEDIAQGGFRPALASLVRATLDGEGRPTSWEQRVVDTPAINPDGIELPYTIAHQSMAAVQSPTHVRASAWRSVGHTQHGFYSECFIDELAYAAGRDAFAYRRDLLPPGSRHRRVLEVAAQRAGWGTALPTGHGRGIAIVESFGSVVAEVIEASFASDGAPRVHRVVAVVDCGTVVHRDTATQQIEGGIVMGLSSALGEAITIDKGAVAQHTLHDYRVLKLAGTPRIEVHFIEDENVAWGGIGEVGVPPAAPALANALAAAGKRIRRLPLIG
ncbi:MAG TPA: molybdopterin cofactor-binding domain-containing protein [Burkholderiaceae bacterium]|nr:molybdopterin cofactor-binding domain-containing protein [Burkholderiaceae bacterium]